MISSTIKRHNPMKFRLRFFFLFALISSNAMAQSLSDIVPENAVTGQSFSMDLTADQKGLVLISFSLDCPFADMYVDRIKALQKNFETQGFRFALVQPHSTGSDRQKMKDFISSSQLGMPFLIDQGGVLSNALSISKIPEAFVMVMQGGKLETAYQGAIDNNPQVAAAATEKILEKAIMQILSGNSPSPAKTRASGCNVRPF